MYLVTVLFKLSKVFCLINGLLWVGQRQVASPLAVPMEIIAKDAWDFFLLNQIGLGIILSVAFQTANSS